MGSVAPVLIWSPWIRPRIFTERREREPLLDESGGAVDSVRGVENGGGTLFTGVVRGTRDGVWRGGERRGVERGRENRESRESQRGRRCGWEGNAKAVGGWRGGGMQGGKGKMSEGYIEVARLRAGAVV